jgi:hypothetical protein
VTAPLLARSLPSTAVPSSVLIDAEANIFPLKWLVDTSVAEEPTFQKTLQELPTPFVKTTLLPDAVVKVLPIWNMKTALASPPALSVNVPVNPADELKQ